MNIIQEACYEVYREAIEAKWGRNLKWTISMSPRNCVTLVDSTGYSQSQLHMLIDQTEVKYTCDDLEVTGSINGACTGFDGDYFTVRTTRCAIDIPIIAITAERIVEAVQQLTGGVEENNDEVIGLQDVSECSGDWWRGSRESIGVFG